MTLLVDETDDERGWFVSWIPAGADASVSRHKERPITWKSDRAGQTGERRKRSTLSSEERGGKDAYVSVALSVVRREKLDIYLVVVVEVCRRSSSTPCNVEHR